MDPENLKTASLYINNQLLSRGLLRNGEEIDFARPDKIYGGGGGGGGSVNARGDGRGGREELGRTMGRIMGVVNDLILRRDRDATQRESLTTTLRTLRADTLLHTTELERLETKLSESQRKLGIAEASERAAKLACKSAENRERGLREEMVKMKSLVERSRKECVVECRKRERTMEGLRKHVGEGAGLRGKGRGVGVREVNVVGGVGKETEEGGSGNGLSVQEEGYDLRNETNEFLTELARGLSEENESLAALVKTTVENLKSLSGCETHPETEDTVAETGYENLASEMENVVEHVRHILTNPSFVPLEEVVVRDEEIQRLRDGWEKMEARWNEAMQLMDGWRKRMMGNGQTVNLEELKMGLLLSPLKANGDLEEEHPEERKFELSTLMEEGEGEGDTQADIDQMVDEEMREGYEDEDEDGDEDGNESSVFEEEPVDEDQVYADEIEEEQAEREEEQEQEQEQDGMNMDEGFTLNTVSSTSPGLVPQLSPLREISGNHKSPNSDYRYQRQREEEQEELEQEEEQQGEREGFSTIIEENTFDLLQLSASPKKQKSGKSTPVPTRRSTRQTNDARTPPEDEIELLRAESREQAPPVPPHREMSSSPHRAGASSPRRPSSPVRTKPTPSPCLHSTSPRKPTPTSNPRPRNTRTPKPAPTPKLQMGSSSILPRPRDLPAQQSPLTMASIAAKLAASEREADAARVRAKIKAARAKRIAQKTHEISAANSVDSARTEPEQAEGNENLGLGTENKRKRKAPASGAGKERGGNSKANRRRSTLNAWELQSLLLGGVESPRKV